MTLEEKNVPDDFTVDARIAEAISTRLSDGKLACAAAFAIAKAYDVEPLTVGRTADALDIRLWRCQLGLFGYPGKKAWSDAKVADLTVPDDLERAIQDAADARDGQLPCADAWSVAARFKVPRMQVGYLADQLGIKITPCQLGAF